MGESEKGRVENILYMTNFPSSLAQTTVIVKIPPLVAP